MSDTTLRLCPCNRKYILSFVLHNSVKQMGKTVLLISPIRKGN